MSIVLIILTGVTVFSVEALVYYILSYRRAFKTRPYSYAYGLASDKEDRLVILKTPVYYDSKTGISWLGKTKIER